MIMVHGNAVTLPTILGILNYFQPLSLTVRAGYLGYDES